MQRKLNQYDLTADSHIEPQLNAKMSDIDRMYYKTVYYNNAWDRRVSS